MSMAERWQADQHQPKVTGAASRGYDKIPEGGVRVTTVSSRGRVIGLLWSDSARAAGYVPAPSSPDGVRASGRMWQVAKSLHDAGESPDAVVNAGDRYAPYDVDPEPRAYDTLTEACKALLGT